MSVVARGEVGHAAVVAQAPPPGGQAGAVKLGRTVPGPLLAEFAVRLRLYLAAIEEPDGACVLFCVRGGLRLQFVFERFLARTGLRCPVLANALMVSRLVAARPAVLAQSPVALDEIAREFHGQTTGDVICALTQSERPRSEEAGRPFDRRWFYESISTTIRREMKRRAAVEPTIGHLKAEHRMGRNHLKGRAGDRINVVLAAAGYNFSLLLRWLTALLCNLIAALDQFDQQAQIA